MQLITISGLDGSGKSTQIKILKDELERNGSRVFYFHAIQFSLAKKLSDFKNKYCLICRLTGKCKTTSVREKSVTRASALQIFLRKIALKIDIWRFSLLRSKLRNKGYDYILSDRYFYDSIVNIAFLENQNNKNSTKTLKKKSYLTKNNQVPKPELAVYLQTTPSLIMSRDRLPDQGLQYLIDKKTIYDDNATSFGMKIVNGDNDPSTVEKEIGTLL